MTFVLHVQQLTALQAAIAELTRPDALALEDARHALRTGVAPPRLHGRLGEALQARREAITARAVADADAVWGELLTPAERTGSLDVKRVVARATPEQFQRLCIGPARSSRAAFQDWFRRHGRAPGGGVRSYASRGGR